MGYAEDIRAFNEWLLTHRLNATEKLLWYRIRFKFDEAGDPKRLAIGSAVLMEMEGLSEPTFRRARKTLVTAKLIKTIQVKGQSTVYELLPIIKDGLREPSHKASEEPSHKASDKASGGASDIPPGEPAHGSQARAREDTYVPGISKNNIIYHSLFSLSDRTPGEGAGEERPTVEEVEEYIRLTGINADARLFVQVNDAAGWKDSNGQPIKNWRIWLNGFAARYPKAPAEKKPTALNFEQRTYKPGELDYLFDWMDKYDECEEAAKTETMQ